jgi:enamine deaminase RidA (YjgF/YER057c/UK114 family)
MPLAKVGRGQHDARRRNFDDDQIWEEDDAMKRPSRPEASAARSKRTPASDRIAVEPLLPVAIPHTNAKLARGMRAGRWVFATGQAATDYVNGVAADLVQPDRPLNGETMHKRQARRIYRNVKEVLGKVGASLPDVVRVDQYYTTERAMHPYHEVRHEVFGSKIPPSTSNLHQRFSRTDQSIELQVMAAVPGSGLKVKHETFNPGYDISAVSGYSPALSAGDFRFVPGQTAEASRDDAGPLDPEVRHPRALWRQWPIKLETQFILQRKLKASLDITVEGRRLGALDHLALGLALSSERDGVDLDAQIVDREAGLGRRDDGRCRRALERRKPDFIEGGHIVTVA